MFMLMLVHLKAKVDEIEGKANDTASIPEQQNLKGT